MTIQNNTTMRTASALGNHMRLAGSGRGCPNRSLGGNKILVWCSKASAPRPRPVRLPRRARGLAIARPWSLRSWGAFCGCFCRLFCGCLKAAAGCEMAQPFRCCRKKEDLSKSGEGTLDPHGIQEGPLFFTFLRVSSCPRDPKSDRWLRSHGWDQGRINSSPNYKCRSLGKNYGCRSPKFACQ